MTDADLIKIASEFRKGMLGKKPSRMCCAMVSYPLAGYLAALHEMECACVETDLGELNHVWIRLADGRALVPPSRRRLHGSHGRLVRAASKVDGQGIGPLTPALIGLAVAALAFLIVSVVRRKES